MTLPTKFNKRQHIEPVNIEGLPSSFLHDGSSIKSQERGVAKLKNRNDTIYSEMHDLAAAHKTKLVTYKDKEGYVVYHIPALDLVVRVLA